MNINSRDWRVQDDTTTGEVVSYSVWTPELEPIEYAPIVRCIDCKHRDPEDKKCDCGHDIMWQLPRSDEWFCADGEKK